MAEGRAEMSLRGGGGPDSKGVEFTSSNTHQAGTRAGAQRGSEPPWLTVVAL